MEIADEFTGPERRGSTVRPDRRQHPRYAVDAWAEVLVLDGTLLFRGRVFDISLAGCFVQTEARLRLRPQTQVEMVFRVNDKMFRLQATSRLARPGIGAGFHFAAMNERMRDELDTLIAELSSVSGG